VVEAADESTIMLGSATSLSHVLRDLFGLDISEGALVNILDARRARH
jgi:hypothetical protein